VWAYPEEVTPTARRIRFPDWLPLLLIALLTLAYLLPILPPFASEPRLGTDIVSQFYPSKTFLKESLQAGHLPLWNPYTFSGVPFFANPQRAALLYPDTLGFLAFPLPVWFAWAQALHLFLAGAGMYLLLLHYTRSRWAGFFAAIAYAFGGFFANRLLMGHLPQMEVSAYLPLVLLLVERMLEASRISRRAVVAALVLALAFFAGFPETVFMIALVVGLRIVGEGIRRMKAGDRSGVCVLLANTGIFLLVALGLIAVQLLPTLELLGHSERVHTSFDALRVRSLPPMNVVTLLLPDFLGSVATKTAVQGGPLGEMNAYAGALTLGLAAVAWYLRSHRLAGFFTLLAATSLLLALGANTPLYHLVYVLPGFQQVAAPMRFVFLFAFAVPVLAGFSLAALLQGKAAATQLRRLVVITFGLALVALVGGIVYLGMRERVLGVFAGMIQAKYGAEEAPRRLAKLPAFYTQQCAGIGALALLAAGSGGLLLLRQRTLRTRRGSGFAALCVLLLLCDLGFYHGKYIKVLPVTEPLLLVGGDFGAFPRKDSAILRVFPLPDVSDYPDQNLIVGVPSLLGYDPIMLRDYRRTLGAIEGKAPEELDSRAPLLGNYRSPLADRWSVGYLLSRQAQTEKALTPLGFANGVYIYQRKQSDPRAYVVHEVTAASDAEALQRMARGEGGLRNGVAFVNEANALSLDTGAAEVARLTMPDPNTLIAEGDAAGKGLLVMSDTYYPGWHATVNGQETPVHRVNAGMRGVAVPAGHYRVTLRYMPTSLTVGSLLSLTTLLLAGGTSVLIFWRSRKATARLEAD
jgi:hypothetical protein